jgi:hypothetical protein
MFYVQLLRSQILKAQKDTYDISVFFTLLRSTSVKAVCKTLMKLTPVVNLINVLRTAFLHVDLECAKKTIKSAVSFGAFGTYEHKSCT